MNKLMKPILYTIIFVLALVLAMMIFQSNKTLLSAEDGKAIVKERYSGQIKRFDASEDKGHFKVTVEDEQKYFQFQLDRRTEKISHLKVVKRKQEKQTEPKTKKVQQESKNKKKAEREKTQQETAQSAAIQPTQNETAVQNSTPQSNVQVQPNPYYYYSDDDDDEMDDD
ncbi:MULTISPECIES: hypothetical protein [unclassified Staphylococcus]|uniref:hypothetical protein n=1 Tax=unclassified Staphylococcus TaxID=91994 RepID=UPI0021D0D5D0|nr:MULTISPECIES: hypothetical protein [unclassified Staphylococcus]UXR77941.1 hypothetical protein MUA92_08930 [Staphylococcus sp. IVB6227]UXR82102.1 hypothetical protein MUA51_08635 [Staphylococcus sp. IVB6214]